MVDLVVLGNLLVDDIVFADGATRMAQAGGAVLHFALAARLNGVSVGIVSWRGDDYPREALEALAERGVDLAGVHAVGGPGLRTWLLYEGRVRHVVHRLQGPSHAEVSPTVEQIPPEWLRSAHAFHLAPMPFPVQSALVDALAERCDAVVALDPYELLRDGDLSAWRRLLARVDIFLVSEDELLVEQEPRDAFAELCGGRLSQIVFKQGAKGGWVYEASAPRPRGVVGWDARVSMLIDPTGAGDAFAAGFLAGRLLGDTLERSLERGVVTASFALEADGAGGLLAASPESAENRLREWFGKAKAVPKPATD